MLFTLALGAAACNKELPAEVELECKKIPSGPGPEDMALDLTYRPRLIISSHDRRNFEKNGELFSYDIQSGILSPIKRRNEPEGYIFKPHGISLVRSNLNETLLYVVNNESKNAGPGNGIGVYKLSGNLALFREYLQDPLIDSPNNLQAMPDGTLYVTNKSSGRVQAWHILFPEKKSTVVFFNGHNWRVAAEGFQFATGIARLENKLYVADGKAHEVVIFDIEANGELNRAETINTAFDNPDNINFDAKGGLLIAEHFDAFSLVHHASNEYHPAPSVIERIQTGNNGMPLKDSSKILYLNSGNEFSAASNAIIYEDQLYLGQVFDWGFLRCKLEGDEEPQ